MCAISINYVKEFVESDDFQELQKRVHIIDEDYRRKWCQTALTERIDFYKAKNIRTIFEKFLIFVILPEMFW